MEFLTDKSDDEKFMDYYRSIPPAHTVVKGNMSLFDFIPKIYGEKRSHSQNWSQYDLAKTNEVYLTKSLLIELLFLSEIEPKCPKKGRKGYSNKDKIFSMFVKTYANSSMRETESMLKEAKNLGYLSQVPSYKSIDNFYKDKSLPDILDRLISLTTIPLISFEKVAAVDSSGFSMSKYAQWSAYKWGKKEGKERIWRKAHIICGCATNIILSAKLTPKDVGDSPMFPMLADEAKRYYDIRDICADKAYSSRENLQFAAELGMIPFIPFKKNTRPNPKGVQIWRTMYEFFRKHQDEFNKRYHQRSLVETSFHMLKTRFGSNLSTKTFEANTVELKMKVLCHNLCVLVQEYFENGATLDFAECVKKENFVKNTG